MSREDDKQVWVDLYVRIMKLADGVEVLDLIKLLAKCDEQLMTAQVERQTMEQILHSIRDLLQTSDDATDFALDVAEMLGTEVGTRLT